VPPQTNGTTAPAHIQIRRHPQCRINAAIVGIFKDGGHRTTPTWKTSPIAGAATPTSTTPPLVGASSRLTQTLGRILDALDRATRTLRR